MDKSISVAITHAPRKKPTLFKTIRSMRYVGFSGIFVFSEPDSEAVGDGAVQMYNEERLGAFANFKHALTWMVENTSSAYIMMAQDDVIFNRMSKMILDDALSPDAGYYTLYLSKHDERLGNKKGDGWHEHKIGWSPCFWGALSLVVPRETCELLLQHPRFTEYDKEKRIDCLVGECMLELNRPMYYHVPSLADHIGYYSTLGHQISTIHGGYRFRQ